MSRSDSRNEEVPRSFYPFQVSDLINSGPMGTGVGGGAGGVSKLQ
jgi:hypothetical protein